MTIDDYKAWYIERYGTKPTERLIESFYRSNGILWPQEKIEEEIPFCPPPKVDMMFGTETDG